MGVSVAPLTDVQVATWSDGDTRLGRGRARITDRVGVGVGVGVRVRVRVRVRVVRRGYTPG